ncbi:MAG: hypothetical protein HGA85_01120, partial [Nanoarchaeota archaeon]|nr:hypothetical protein [Nanoarchaeota archaeon]
TAGRELLKVLDARFLLDLNLKNLNKEIKEMEGKMKRAEELVKKSGKKEDVSYIG